MTQWSVAQLEFPSSGKNNLVKNVGGKGELPKAFSGIGQPEAFGQWDLGVTWIEVILEQGCIVLALGQKKKTLITDAVRQRNKPKAKKQSGSYLPPCKAFAQR